MHYYFLAYFGKTEYGQDARGYRVFRLEDWENIADALESKLDDIKRTQDLLDIVATAFNKV